MSRSQRMKVRALGALALALVVIALWAIASIVRFGELVANGGWLLSTILIVVAGVFALLWVCAEAEERADGSPD